MTKRHDSAERRQAQRKQRERGCSIYIPAEVLSAVGFSLDEPPPFYRTFRGKRGVVIINLYREK